MYNSDIRLFETCVLDTTAYLMMCPFDFPFYLCWLDQSLDPALQEALAAYVTELGVSHDLFRFIEAYAVIKEQREYTDWLTRFKNFL